MIREYIIEIPDEFVENEYQAKPSQIVRCRDCKWRNTGACFCNSPMDTKPDWYCWAGEEKEMTTGNLQDALAKATHYICKIAEDKQISNSELHQIGDIMAVMHQFISEENLGEN